MLKCLAKSADQRYATARELEEDLQAFKAGEPVKARPPGVFSAIAYQLRRHVLAASVSGSVALLLLLLVAWTIVRSFTQSVELAESNAKVDRLTTELQFLRDSIQTTLSDEDRVNLETAALDNLARHAADPELRARAAAELVLISSKQNATIDSHLMEVLQDYASQESLAVAPSPESDESDPGAVQATSLAQAIHDLLNDSVPPAEEVGDSLEED